MTGLTFVHLDDRAVIKITGDDRASFLQGLISNDVARLNEGTPIHAALLTPQGKYLHDFFIAPLGNGSGDGDAADWLLDCEKDRAADLLKRLKLYKLRSKVTLEDVSEAFSVFTLAPESADLLGLGADSDKAVMMADGLIFRDTRLSTLGGRAVLPAGATPKTLNADLSAASSETYDALRVSLGVPDGAKDLIIEKSILLESGFDELNGVDWNKGCYMGQELTARTKYRGLVKKRLVPVVIDGGAPEAGTAIQAGGKDVGEVRSSSGDHAIALVRLEALEAGGLETNGRSVTAQKPDWAEF